MTAVSTDCRLRFEDIDRWGIIRPAWSKLHATNEAATFFLSADWVDAWISVYAQGLGVRFALLERGGATVGAALVCTRNERRGPFIVRQLHLNTAGEGSDSPMLEHNALLCAPGLRDTFAKLLSRALLAESWDELVLPGICEAEWAALSPWCSAPTATQWLDAPYVDLEALRRERLSYLDSLSGNTRHQIRRSIALYGARGELRLEHALGNDQAVLWFDELVNLHQAAWSAQGKAGAFASPRQRAFHQRVIAAGIDTGAVQVLRVRAGQDTIGVLYNLSHGGHVSYYQSGFRFEADNRLKPGLVCHALAIQAALDAGVREYDFLAVAKDGSRYKQSLANASRRLGWITIRRECLKLRVLDTLNELRRRWL